MYICCTTAQQFDDSRVDVCPGVDVEYDQAVSDIQTVEQTLREYLDQQKKILCYRVSN